MEEISSGQPYGSGLPCLCLDRIAVGRHLRRRRDTIA
jgi:hypothetical protein